jgi:ribosomal protein L37AE/L43A
MARYFSDNNPRQSSAEPAVSPKSCPACASLTISSTAKVPTAESYWRCTKCGEVWSPARRVSHSTRRW